MKRRNISKKSNPSKQSNDLQEDQIDRIEFEKDLKRTKKQSEQKHQTHLDIIDIKPINHFENDVYAAFKYLHMLCQNSNIIKHRSLIPVVWRHQLYSLFSFAGRVDSELNKLISSDRIRILCHGESSLNNDAIVLLEDYVRYFKNFNKLLINLFISKVVVKKKTTCYTNEELKRCGFGPDAVKTLTSFGLLTKNDDLDDRQLSFAGLGILVSTLAQGRDKLLKVLSKCKYSQILQSDLIQRHATTSNSFQEFGLEFQLYDLYGRDVVERRSANLGPNDCLIQLILK
ncbi:COP9 signalosome complex subunit2 [Sarcoptes scabiei]|nr:COP9 signalosome complex subunit2 [Sarcoptes scabiei]